MAQRFLLLPCHICSTEEQVDLVVSYFSFRCISINVALCWPLKLHLARTNTYSKIINVLHPFSLHFIKSFGHCEVTQIET